MKDYSPVIKALEAVVAFEPEEVGGMKVWDGAYRTLRKLRGIERQVRNRRINRAHFGPHGK